MDTVSQPSPDAATKAERQADVHFDFELEDIIAGNMPASDVGKAILAIVENGQDAADARQDRSGADAAL